MENTDIVVYTAVAGGKDKILTVNPKFKGVNYILFTDQDISQSEGKSLGWDIVYPIIDFSDDKKFKHRRNAKLLKIKSFEYLEDYQYNIWMDGTHMPKMHPNKIINKYLPKGKYISTFNHPRRICAYDEGNYIINNLPHLDYPKLIAQQLKYYKQKGMPENLGLPANTVIIRKWSEEIEALENAWWEQICKFSSRDQISLPYVLWSLGLWDIHHYMPGHWERNDFIPRVRPHIKVKQ